jgi:hypothetical protein
MHSSAKPIISAIYGDTTIAEFEELRKNNPDYQLEYGLEERFDDVRTNFYPGTTALMAAAAVGNRILIEHIVEKSTIVDPFYLFADGCENGFVSAFFYAARCHNSEKAVPTIKKMVPLCKTLHGHQFHIELLTEAVQLRSTKIVALCVRLGFTLINVSTSGYYHERLERDTKYLNAVKEEVLLEKKKFTLFRVGLEEYNPDVIYCILSKYLEVIE